MSQGNERDHAAWQRYLNNFLFYNYACSCDDCCWVRENWKPAMPLITVTFDESERQAMLLALAALAVERPGWDYMLNLIALKMDRNIGGQAYMYTVLKDIRLRRLVPDLPHKAFILNSVPLSDLMRGESGDTGDPIGTPNF